MARDTSTTKEDYINLTDHKLAVDIGTTPDTAAGDLASMSADLGTIQADLGTVKADIALMKACSGCGFATGSGFGSAGGWIPMTLSEAVKVPLDADFQALEDLVEAEKAKKEKPAKKSKS